MAPLKSNIKKDLKALDYLYTLNSKRLLPKNYQEKKMKISRKACLM